MGPKEFLESWPQGCGTPFPDELHLLIAWKYFKKYAGQLPWTAQHAVICILLEYIHHTHMYIGLHWVDHVSYLNLITMSYYHYLLHIEEMTMSMLTAEKEQCDGGMACL